VTDNLGHVEYTAFSPLFGTPSSRTDHNNLITSWQYDDLGRHDGQTGL
jgi:hypothetical protein